jgi:hypothetical protein
MLPHLPNDLLLLFAADPTLELFQAKVDDIELLHRIWLDLSDALAPEELHHHVLPVRFPRSR